MPASHVLPNRVFWEAEQFKIAAKYLTSLVGVQGFEPLRVSGLEAGRSTNVCAVYAHILDICWTRLAASILSV